MFCAVIPNGFSHEESAFSHSDWVGRETAGSSLLKQFGMTVLFLFLEAKS
jgi:hypothetical protein